MLCYSSVGRKFGNFINVRLTGADRSAPWKGGKTVAPGKRSAARSLGNQLSEPGKGDRHFCRPLGGLVHCWHGIPRAALRLPGAVFGPVGASQPNAPFEGASSCHPLCGWYMIHCIRVRPALPVIAGRFVKRMPDIGFRYAVRHRGIATGSSWSSSSVLLFFIACHRSQSSCNPSQKSADVRKTRASRSAVSGVTERLARIISLRRGKDTPRRTANSDCVMPSGFRNSSRSISPGCVGGLPRGKRRSAIPCEGISWLPALLGLMIVDNLDFIGIFILPAETDTILLVDSNAVSGTSIRFQSFKP
jgi:hypothetical protein